MTQHRRGYDSLFLQRVEEADQHPLVLELANVCIDRHIPMSEVAALVGVSRVTVYNWMKGAKPRTRHLAILSKVTAQLRKRRV